MVSSSSSTSSAGSANITGGLISFGGLASGIDTTSIINALMQVEQQPVTMAQSRLTTVQQRQASLTSISAGIAGLDSAVSGLTDITAIGARSASTDPLSADSSKVSVSATNAAATGSFTVQVLGLASSSTAASGAAIGSGVALNTDLADAGFSQPVTTGTFSINGTQITIDSSTVLSDGTDLPGANTVLSKINNAGIGVTASVVADADGRQNLIRLSAASSIQLGSGGDTSNFLSAANLLQSPSGTTRTSTRPLGGVVLGSALNAAGLRTALSASTGQFTINGVAISWDSTVDSMSQVISRINASAAGVTATYDSLADRITLTAKQTGSSTISLADNTGNFLGATGLLAAPPTLGANASYKINGGATQYSTSNTVADALPGVSMTLSGVTSGALTVTVSADTSILQNRLQTFVDAYNSVMGSIATETQYGGGSGAANGPLFGDPTIMRVQQQLRALISQQALGMTGDISSLTSIGLNFGAVGSTVGTTNTLALDTTKFQAAMASNPDAVAELLSSFTSTASLDAGGNGSVVSISGTPSLAKMPGKYTIAASTDGSTTVTFLPDDGSAPIVSHGTLVAGGANTSIIPGVTITASNPLQTGTDTITLTATQEGIGVTMEAILGQLTASSGALAAETDETSKQITDINSQIKTLNVQVAAKKQELNDKFNAMEQAIQNLKNQQSALTALQTTLSQNSTKTA